MSRYHLCPRYIKTLHSGEHCSFVKVSAVDLPLQFRVTMIGIKLGLLLVFCVLAKCSATNVQSKYHLSSRIDPGVRFILETDECAGVGYRIVRNNQTVFESSLGHFAPLSSAIDHGNKIILISNQDQIVLELVEDTPAIFIVDISRRNIKSDKSITDCVSLGKFINIKIKFKNLLVFRICGF